MVTATFLFLIVLIAYTAIKITAPLFKAILYLAIIYATLNLLGSY